MYNPLLDTIKEILKKGADTGKFRDDVDPTDLYISITALSAHYISHRYTFEAIFNQGLMKPARLQQRIDHAADMIIRYLEK